MVQLTPVHAAIDALGRNPLRHIVLLKQLLAYPEHVRVHRVAGPEGAATLVALDTSASPYDRQAYPGAVLAAFIASDHPDLTAALLSYLPASDVRQGAGIVFKLSSDADLAPVEARFPVVRRTALDLHGRNLSAALSARSSRRPWAVPHP